MVRLLSVVLALALIQPAFAAGRPRAYSAAPRGAFIWDGWNRTTYIERRVPMPTVIVVTPPATPAPTPVLVPQEDYDGPTLIINSYCK